MALMILSSRECRTDSDGEGGHAGGPEVAPGGWVACVGGCCVGGCCGGWTPQTRSGGDRPADADLGGCDAGGQTRPGGGEAEAGLGFAVPVPVTVNDNAVTCQGGQRVVAARGDQRGGQAGGGRPGPGRGHDGVAG